MADLLDLLHNVDPKRFWKRVSIGSADACWPWLGSRFSQRGVETYGRFYLSKTRVAKAHRVAWFLTRQEWPDGMAICHSCDNPPCCNPSHLWKGTRADNNRDRALKGRSVSPQRVDEDVDWACGERHGCAKLTIDDVLKIKDDPRPLPQVATDYGVSISAISRIRIGKSWKRALRALLSQEASDAPADRAREIDNGFWTECWQCFGVGMLAGCFEDTCSCMGDPEDPEDCCSPRTCDICKGKGGYYSREADDAE